MVRGVDMPVIIPYEQTFDGLYGLQMVHVGDGLVRAEVPVRDALKQSFGLVHGGVYASIAESIASIATYRGVIGDGNMAMGLSNQTSFMRPITEGTIHAEARVRHRGRTTWLWDVDITDDAGRLCAVSRMTIAVKPRPGSAGG
jgi:uncharacterized protein (TIGR00369 family)